LPRTTLEDVVRIQRQAAGEADQRRQDGAGKDQEAKRQIEARELRPALLAARHPAERVETHTERQQEQQRLVRARDGQGTAPVDADDERCRQQPEEGAELRGYKHGGKHRQAHGHGGDPDSACADGGSRQGRKSHRAGTGDADRHPARAAFGCRPGDPVHAGGPMPAGGAGLGVPGRKPPKRVPAHRNPGRAGTADRGRR
jgi:hypothetical protein